MLWNAGKHAVLYVRPSTIILTKQVGGKLHQGQRQSPAQKMTMSMAQMTNAQVHTHTCTCICKVRVGCWWVVGGWLEATCSGPGWLPPSTATEMSKRSRRQNSSLSLLTHSSLDSHPLNAMNKVAYQYHGHEQCSGNVLCGGCMWIRLLHSCKHARMHDLPNTLMQALRPQVF